MLVLEIARTKSQQIFYCALAVDTLYPRVTIVPTIRTFFSLKRLVVVDTYYIYGMQQFLYWRVQVLLLYGGHQKVIDVVGGWYEAAIEQQVLGACVESFQGHVISLSLHGWHLSRNLRAFLARLIALFSSSELDVHVPRLISSAVARLHEGMGYN